MKAVSATMALTGTIVVIILRVIAKVLTETETIAIVLGSVGLTEAVVVLTETETTVVIVLRSVGLTEAVVELAETVVVVIILSAIVKVLTETETIAIVLGSVGLTEAVVVLTKTIAVAKRGEYGVVRIGLKCRKLNIWLLLEGILSKLRLKRLVVRITIPKRKTHLDVLKLSVCAYPFPMDCYL